MRRRSRSRSRTSSSEGWPASQSSSMPHSCANAELKKLEPLVGAVDRDRGMDVFEHLAVRVDVARRARSRRFRDRCDRRRSRSCRRRASGSSANFEQPARAADDDMPRARSRSCPPAAAPGQCPRLLAAAVGSQLAAFGQHRLARRVERAGIGSVAVDEPQVAVAPPHRQRDRIEGLPQSGGGGRSAVAALLGGARLPTRRSATTRASPLAVRASVDPVFRRRPTG